MWGKNSYRRGCLNPIRRLRWKRKNPWSASFDRRYCSQLRAQLRRLNQADPGFYSQEPEKLSSDVTTTSISMPDQSPPSPSRSDDHLKGSDQATPDSVKFDTQEELSSHVTTTSMPDQAISSSDQVQRCDSSSTSAMLVEKKKEEDE